MQDVKGPWGKVTPEGPVAFKTYAVYAPAPDIFIAVVIDPKQAVASILQKIADYENNHRTRTYLTPVEAWDFNYKRIDHASSAPDAVERAKNAGFKYQSREDRARAAANGPWGRQPEAETAKPMQQPKKNEPGKAGPWTKTAPA